MADQQQEIDVRNATFWDELCGTGLAQSLGIEEVTDQSLRRFDEAYLGTYPYLESYLPRPATGEESLLEVGLGFGTVGQLLAERGFTYTGVDIAEGPVAMMSDRLRSVGARAGSEARVASVLELPFDDASFDHVVALGCLHHTGDLPRAISEVHRVLRPGGRTLVMVYNSRSYRHVVKLRPAQALRRLRGEGDDEFMRAAADVNEAGEAAPSTEFISRADAKRLFSRFAEVRVRSENFDPVTFGRSRIVISRERMLGLPARAAGLDLYIVATK